MVIPWVSVRTTHFTVECGPPLVSSLILVISTALYTTLFTNRGFFVTNLSMLNELLKLNKYK
jgi:hypothetical protein